MKIFTASCLPDDNEVKSHWLSLRSESRKLKPLIMKERLLHSPFL